MPTGPKGEKRPADVVGAAIKVARIATGEIKEDAEQDSGKSKAAVELGRRGGKAQAKSMSAERRSRDRAGRIRQRRKARIFLSIGTIALNSELFIAR